MEGRLLYWGWQIVVDRDANLMRNSGTWMAFWHHFTVPTAQPLVLYWEGLWSHRTVENVLSFLLSVPMVDIANWSCLCTRHSSAELAKFAMGPSAYVQRMPGTSHYVSNQSAEPKGQTHISMWFHFRKFTPLQASLCEILLVTPRKCLHVP